MKRFEAQRSTLPLAMLLSFILAGVLAQGSVAQAKALDVCGLVPTAQAAQILGYPVDTSHSGDTTTHCIYLGKRGYADLRVFPNASDGMAKMLAASNRNAPAGHSLASQQKGDDLVMVTVSPTNDRAAQAMLKAAIGRL